MLLERTLHTLQKIGNERLQLPIFYECPVALRFEIGDPEIAVYLHEDTLNPLYFRNAFRRISYLYEKAAPFDTLLWVLYSEPDSAKDDIVAALPPFRRLTQLPEPTELYHQDTVDADGNPLTRVFLFWDMEQTPPKRKALLEAILKADFSFPALSSAVFFFDTRRHLLFHPYDDRGLDLVAEKKETLLPFYTDCQNWLLDYDRERMKRMFAEPL